MLIPSFVLFFLIITKKDKLLNFFEEELLEKLKVPNSYISNKARNIFLFFSLILMIIALSRPVTNEKEINLQSTTKPFIIILDISKSMKAIDLYPNRLEFAKKKILQIIDNSKDNSIGIILFAKSSFILSPLTQDFDSLKILLNNLDLGVDFDNGTNIFSALELSNKLLKDFSTKNILILSDGGDNSDFREEINFANENNLKIYTIAMATKKGAVIKLEDQNYLTNKNKEIVTLKLNENIKTLSLNTNGGYINFTINDDDIKEILKDINKNSKNNSEIKKQKIYVELFYYPLCLSILLLFISFFSLPKIRFFKNIFLITLIFSFNENLNAIVFDFQTIKEAKKAYENSNYEQAIDKFEKLNSSNERNYNLANSYYKQKNYSKAIELYKQIQSDDFNFNFSVLHNLANTYALNSNYDEAIKTYEKALKLKNDKKTKENLELIKSLKNNTKKDENRQKEKNSQEKEKDKNNSKVENEIKKEKENKEISNYEEEKWLKEIENQKPISLMKKFKSSKEIQGENPW